MKKIWCVLFAFMAIATTQAQAAPFGFAADSGTYITQGYQGFNYGGGGGTSSWVNDTVLPIHNNYGVSQAALGAAWSNGGTPLTLTSAIFGQQFDIASLSLNVGWTTTVTLQGWVNGLLINTWSQTVLNQYDYTDVILNWSGIDTLTFSGGPNLFVTNIDTSIAGEVPEPASLALFAAGLFGLGSLSRRKTS